jgi:hypothetical protein
MKELTAIEWLEIELKGVYESEYFNLKIKEARILEVKQRAIEAKKNYLEGFKASVEAVNDLYKDIEKHFNNHKI